MTTPTTPDNPAQEAAKAGPKCRLVGIGPHVCSGGVAMRVMRNMPVGLYCETAYRTREATIAHLSDVYSTGTRYEGLSRLPRPKLAHSMGIEDPALPEAR